MTRVLHRILVLVSLLVATYAALTLVVAARSGAVTHSAPAR
ncbi:MAG: hypothetical protein WEE50_11415 [Chloroflexota bacterium]|jgi:hypothetical protein